MSNTDKRQVRSGPLLADDNKRRIAPAVAGWPLALVGLIAGLAAPAAASEPGDGSSQTRQLSLLTRLPVPCVSYAVTGGRVILSRPLLQSLADNPADARQGEASRLAAIAADRAQALLQSAGTTADASGCAPVAPAGQANQDAQFLLDQMLTEGKAAVLRDGTAQLQPRILLQEENDAIRGSRLFRYQPDGTIFLNISRWIR